MPTTPDILVVEDDAVMRAALAEWLEAAGYGVRTAADGRAGLDVVRAIEPALVITDMHMPGASGSEVIVAMRHHHPAVPVIAISGLFHSGHGIGADAAIALGASRTLAKPFRRGELLQAVSELLGP